MKTVVGLEARSDLLAQMRLEAKSTLILMMPEFHLKLFLASQAEHTVAELKELLHGSLQPSPTSSQLNPMLSVVTGY